jgi:hypothetical protein
MAIERKTHAVKALQSELVVFSLRVPSTSGALVLASGVGDISLVSSITDVGTGEFRLNLRQFGYKLVGAQCTPIVASPGANDPMCAVVKSFDESAKTITFAMLKADGTVEDLTDGDSVLITLFFKNSSS